MRAPVLIGDPSCIRDGDRYPRVPLNIILVGGWDSRCPRLIFPPIDQTDCHFQQWTLDVIEQLYNGTEADVIAAVHTRYPTAAIHVELSATDITPAICIVRVAGCAIAITAGTQKMLQWVVQFLNGAIGPQRYLYYTTLAFWQSGSIVLSDVLIRAGVTTAQQIIFVGHSLGAAISAISAFRARQASATRDVGLLTFGCPKPGDRRLIEGLFTVRQNNYLAEGDPVVFLPPSGWDAIALSFLLPFSIVQACRDFIPLQNRTMLLNNGQFTVDFNEESILPFLVREVIRWVTAPPDFSPPYAHSPQNYRRLDVCPDEPPEPPDFFYVWFGGGWGNGSLAQLSGEGVQLGGGALFLRRVLGGIALGGAAVFGEVAEPVGGVALGGAAVFGEVAEPVGGVALGGAAVFGEVAEPLGGVALGGAALFGMNRFVVYDQFVGGLFEPLHSHDIDPIDLIGASWPAGSNWGIDPPSAASLYFLGGDPWILFDVQRADCLIEANLYPLPPDLSYPSGKSVSLIARSPDDGGLGWWATVFDNGDGTGLLRLEARGGGSGFTGDVALPSYVNGDVVSLECDGPVVTATCEGLSVVYSTDTDLASNQFAGMGTDAPTPLVFEYVHVGEFKVHTR